LPVSTAGGDVSRDVSRIAATRAIVTP